MGLFSTLKEKIFGHPAAKAAPAPAAPTAAAPAAAAPVAPAPKAVDVMATLEHMAKESGQPSNWQTSIVDLMKLVGMDSSLASRKELAADLGYTGDTNDSASMNIWLHKQVMAKLAEAKV
jgi:3-oxoacyl-ACP reductase-like protein